MPQATLAPEATPRKAEATDHKYITRTPGVCGGEPAIVGTRVTVRDVVCMLRIDGGRCYTPERLAGEAYPHVSLAQVYDALSYYHDHTHEIERLIDLKEVKEEDVHDGPIITK